MDQIRHILVATDGSDGAIAAAELAGFLARGCNSRVSIVVVHSEAALLLPGFTDVVLPGSVPFAVFPREEAKQHIEKAASEHTLPDTERSLGVVPGGTKVVQIWGHTVEEICKYATANRVDMIVVGRHGHRSFKSLLIGGTSSQIIAHAPCPVAIAQ